jgi:hypothetical protein
MGKRRQVGDSLMFQGFPCSSSVSNADSERLLFKEHFCFLPPICGSEPNESRRESTTPSGRDKLVRGEPGVAIFCIQDFEGRPSHRPITDGFLEKIVPFGTKCNRIVISRPRA